jgi:hypothetical protein
MATDDEAARKERARRLREQIGRLKTARPGQQGEEQESPARRPKTPRDFIEEKMRESEEKEKQ